MKSLSFGDPPPSGAPAQGWDLPLNNHRRGGETTEIDVSVVMPCLNEAECIDHVIDEARAGFNEFGVRGEIIVVDNGSTDGSDQIARARGARVVVEARRGYGNAYRTGLDVAVGECLLLSDADGTYDLRGLGEFVAALEAGADLVVGTRLRGRIDVGAMPWLHNHVGNPAISHLMNWAFGTSLSDVYCGIRCMSRAAYEQLDLRASGMEFALEVIVEGARRGLVITEVPVPYRRRKGGASKLRRWRDGCRTLGFVMSRRLAWTTTAQRQHAEGLT
jgi:glycosyltransferase involved in cell wall biosynthesis